MSNVKHKILESCPLLVIKFELHLQLPGGGIIDHEKRIGTKAWDSVKVGQHWPLCVQDQETHIADYDVSKVPMHESCLGE